MGTGRASRERVGCIEETGEVTERESAGVLLEDIQSPSIATSTNSFAFLYTISAYLEGITYTLVLAAKA